MHKHKTMGERFSQLPLPAAHLVVDIRGGSDRRSIDWLQVELTDLASEMQSLNVPRWRAVNEFLSFLRLSPDVQGSREDAVQMKKDRLVQEIEHVRESRARAMQEDSQAGHAGHSSDTRVRVLFLVDLIFPASLSCALLWAKHLKNHYGKHMQSARHGGLCIAVVCLGNVEEEGRPEFLRQELGRYQAGIYLDTLIFSENCYQSPPLEERAQGWLAAQLLYALLLFFSPSFTFFSPEPAAPLSGSEEGPQPAIWPGQIYLVHVAALEDTARWGRHWLNHGLAQALIETLCLPHDLSEQEKIQAADLGISWFRDWLGRLQKSIPLTCAALAGLPHARNVPVPVLPFLLAGPGSRKNALAGLESYLHQLADTYVTTGSAPSLQDTLLQGRSVVMQAPSEKESSQNVISLQAFQREARQVLRTPGFWQNTSQPLASAPFFLEGLAGACSDLQQAYLLNPLNVRAQRQKGKDIGQRKQDLLDEGRHTLRELTMYYTRWPGLTSFPLIRRLMQWCTFFLQASLTFLALFLGIAELHHIIQMYVPGLLPVLDIPGPLWLNLLAIGLCSLLVACEFRALRASFSRQRASDLVIAGTYLLFLALLGLCGLLISLGFASLAHASDDPTSVVYLAWLAPVAPFVTRITSVALALLVLGEAIYLLCWSSRLRTKYRRIIYTWQQQQQRDVRDVIDCITVDVALEIAQQAGICDRAGGPGRYFYRISQLPAILKRLSTSAQQYADLAAERLSFSWENVQWGVEREWILAHPEGEALHMDFLADEYAELRQQITREHTLRRALAEYLLRAQGAEDLEELAQEMRTLLSEVESVHRPLLRLLLSLVALTTRNMVDPLPISRIDLRKGEYRNEQEYIEAEMLDLPAYIQAFHAQVSPIGIAQACQHQSGRLDQWPARQAKIHLTVQLLALVAQLVWQQKGSEQCRQRLALNGIWERLEYHMPGPHLPDMVLRRLQAYARKGTSGRQRADQYLLAATASLGPSLSQELKGLMSSRVLDIPDQERLLLLGIRRVVAR